METKLLLIVAAGVFCGGLLYYYSRKKEGFKVLGSIGATQRNLYYKCTSDCERSDPGKQLSPFKGNLMCQEYCDSAITDMVRRGGPSYPYRPMAKTVPITTTIDEAYDVCGDGESGRWCRTLYHTGKEIDQKCRQDCEYS